MLIERVPSVVAEADGTRDRRVPLYEAAMSGFAHAARLLLGNGSAFDVANKKDWQPLHYAADRGNTEVVQILIERGANIDARSHV